MDVPSDSYMSSMADPTVAANVGPEHLLQYSATSSSPAAEDCQASSDYMYNDQQQPYIKSEFSNEQFASLAPSYMMAMNRSFSDNQLSMTSGIDSGSATLVKMETCDSPMTYPQQSIHEDDYSYQYHQQQLYQHHPHHSHSYSTSSLSSLSDSSSSMSPRSPFSSDSLSLSSSTTSLATSCALTRTLSEPSMFQQASVSASSSIGDLTSFSNSSNGSLNSMIKPTPKRSRGRRVSSQPDNSGCKVFTCRFEDCGKIFKRSEHLKRHVRSIHTLEKPFACPIQNCPKRFSRSDNLNQHIRIHRHTNGSRLNEKTNKAFASFTPFLQTYSTDLISL
ncbi:hypothetical protein BG011_004109 [Mortierella polycephala]|uniref:C2H2-type domain-containing protein n=1 Tax=Mortierella polycephala TaxID=41804 RepID=A0A9P6QG01_9FUNG|nr:hypothetical protein BG011_004109 [Mortierella polycephala]